jgi:hypothetical protein
MNIIVVQAIGKQCFSMMDMMVKQFDIHPMVDKEQWPKVDLGFVIVPQKLERPAGRPRVCRIKSSDEAGKRDLTNARDASGLAILKRRCFYFEV